MLLLLITNIDILLFVNCFVGVVPSFIIICFVTTICVAILLSVITFFIRSRLYPGKKPTIVDPRITDNAFVILIHKQPEMTSGDIETINLLFMKNGAVEVIEK